jgi:hypothetical protein
VLVDTHAFKEAFVEGRAMGFVIADESSPTTHFATRPGFAEIFDLRESYYIFEERARAEARVASAVARNPALTGLVIREVNVDSIRDYQLLAGRKTVFLVDREGQTTQSLRVGDMPLAARTNTPFPGPMPRGTRFLDPPPPKPAPLPPPAASPSRASADTITPPERTAPRRKPTLYLPASEEPEPSPLAKGEKPPGWLSSVMQRLRGKG